MVFCIMLGLMVIKTDYSMSIIKMNEIQAIEMIDKGKNGGILTISLKGDKAEQVVCAEDDKDKWIEAKEWMDSNILNLSSEINKQDVLYHRDTHPGF